MRPEHAEEFSEFARSRGPVLRRSAYLMCGDWHEADDLAQTALTKLYLAWPRVRAETAEAYARRVLVRCFLDARRRPWRREHPVEQVPDRPDGQPGHDLRLVVLAALRALPPRRRAVVVLRYWWDLSIAETAAALDCTEGTVKKQAHAGLDTLRQRLAGSGLELAFQPSHEGTY